MRFSIVLTALLVAVAAGCAKAPSPVAPAGLAQGTVTAAAKTPTVRVGQIEKLPVRCPCFRLEGTIGTQAFSLQFEQSGQEAVVDVFQVGGKKATAAEKKAIAQGIYAEAEEAMTQEATNSAERARQLFAVAAALGVAGPGKGGKPTGDKPAFKVDEVASLPVRCPCFKLTATMGDKAVKIEYEVQNGFAGQMHQIREVTVEGRRPTADELKAIAAGLNAEGDVAIRQEATNSAAKAKLYYALAKALTR